MGGGNQKTLDWYFLFYILQFLVDVSPSETVGGRTTDAAEGQGATAAFRTAAATETAGRPVPSSRSSSEGKAEGRTRETSAAAKAAEGGSETEGRRT